MIAIAITDPWAAILNDVTDLETKLPGACVCVVEWCVCVGMVDVLCAGGSVCVL